MKDIRQKAIKIISDHFEKLPATLVSSDYDLDTFCRKFLRLPSRPSDDRVYGWLTPIQEFVTYTPDLTTSKAGINFIKLWEGLRLKAYRCPAGKWTIGYGTTKGVKAGQEITQREAESLLRNDLVVFEDATRNLVKVQLSQNQFDALVSFVYNVGEGAFAKSTLLQVLNEGKFTEAANNFDNGASINSSADTFAAIRNSLNERKYHRFYIPSGDPEFPGTFKEGVEQNAIMIWDDIDPSVFTRTPEIYRLFKFGYDRSCSVIQISSEKPGSNLKFDCFCPKVFSSIHPFHVDPSFPEFKRRLLTIPTSKLETITNADSKPLDIVDYDWTGLDVEFKQYWCYQKAGEYLATRRAISRGLRLKSEQKIVCVDLVTTAVTTGLWDSLTFANTKLNSYFDWLKSEQEEEKDSLEKMIQQLVESEEQQAREKKLEESRVYVVRLRGLIETWYETGYLVERPKKKRIRELMRAKGYRVGKTGAWCKKL
ncbi:glycoside hydrolase family 24 [Stanieria cyanosphaera PCC 7437]|uniref:Lysozyme n=1 Tax=Stanieria cyanosphaera (strain ATCC 29371 / PCC 7437) TaxID=111780 RepID=K9XRH0_STAC7|nr:lysozyme [Stanieria cyanosphaera]AFZ34651.1 glycoside hydrolase family 24 [Stanieria cyanosphaera PCC 7437]